MIEKPHKVPRFCFSGGPSRLNAIGYFDSASAAKDQVLGVIAEPKRCHPQPIFASREPTILDKGNGSSRQVFRKLHNPQWACWGELT